MKKLVLAMVAVFAMSFATSCGNNKPAANADSLSNDTAVVDSAVDSAAVDSAAADSAI